MRTVFIGSTKRGFLALQTLFDAGATVVGIVSIDQHAHETDRYEEKIAALAKSKDVPLWQMATLKDADYPAIIADLNPDLIFVVGCRVLLPETITSIPKHGCLAIHDSLLPAYRGFAPLQWSIINGEDYTGVTLFYLNERMDEGDIVMQKKVNIGPDEMAGEIYDRLNAAAVYMIRQQYPLLASGKASRKKQPGKGATYTCSRCPADGWIDWNQDTVRIYNTIRALGQPFPGAFTSYKGAKLFLWQAQIVKSPTVYVGRIPGRVIGVSSKDGWVDVLTKDGVLRLLTVQCEGGPVMPAASVITSIRSSLGMSFQELRP